MIRIIKNLWNEYINSNNCYPTLLIIGFVAANELCRELESLHGFNGLLMYDDLKEAKYMGMEILVINQPNYIRVCR